MYIDDLYGVFRALIDGVSDVPFIVIAFEQGVQISVERGTVVAASIQRVCQLIEIVDLDQVLSHIADPDELSIDIEDFNDLVEDLRDRHRIEPFCQRDQFSAQIGIHKGSRLDDIVDLFISHFDQKASRQRDIGKDEVFIFLFFRHLFDKREGGLQGINQVGIGHLLVFFDDRRDIEMGQDLLVQIEIRRAVDDDAEVSVFCGADFVPVFDHEGADPVSDIFCQDEGFRFVSGEIRERIDLLVVFVVQDLEPLVLIAVFVLRSANGHVVGSPVGGTADRRIHQPVEDDVDVTDDLAS